MGRMLAASRSTASALIASALVASVLLSVAGCSAVSTATASVGIARSQGGTLIAVVRVCEGSVEGVQLFAADEDGRVFGAHESRITRWVAPDPVTAVGATDLLGETYWPSDAPVVEFERNREYTISAYSSGTTSASTVTFTASDLDGIGIEHVLATDPMDHRARTVSMVDFFDTACDFAS